MAGKSCNMPCGWLAREGHNGWFWPLTKTTNTPCELIDEQDLSCGIVDRYLRACGDQNDVATIQFVARTASIVLYFVVRRFCLAKRSFSREKLVLKIVCLFPKSIFVLANIFSTGKQDAENIFPVGICPQKHCDSWVPTRPCARDETPEQVKGLPSGASTPRIAPRY